MAARCPGFVGVLIGSTHGDGSYLINQFHQCLGSASYQIIGPPRHTTISKSRQTQGVHSTKFYPPIPWPRFRRVASGKFFVMCLHGCTNAYIGQSDELSHFMLHFRILSLPCSRQLSTIIFVHNEPHS
jgi:hypothetical protein